VIENRQILFVQGGGAGAHDEWDEVLVEGLRRELGAGYEVRYPQMPDEGDPSYAKWSAAIRGELTGLDDGDVLVGHSVGGTILAYALTQQSLDRDVAAVVLIAAPFVGIGGWRSDEFELPREIGATLPPRLRVHVFHGLEDETSPPSHADLYAGAIPQAQLHLLPGRDHQLNNDMSDVAKVIIAETSLPDRREIAVRPAGLHDLGEVGRLLHDFNCEFGEAAPPPSVLADRLRQLHQGGDTVTLIAGEGPDGLAVLRFRAAIWSRGLECYLAELYVVPGRRRRGVGRALMDAAIREARDRGADTMDIGVDEPDVAARHLYESLGFTNCAGGADGPVMYVYERDL
jgi:GNAT superfamily N-acetyltransferase/predicted alpha/beta hydrolase family esterase